MPVIEPFAPAQALIDPEPVFQCPSKSTDDLQPYLGTIIRHSFNGGYIALSLFVSFAGSWTAVELLHRRGSPHGVHNWFLLLGAATAMGAVAIWCMHYIGNRAIVMCDGHPSLVIQYSPGFTAGSFFLAITGVSVAFYFFGIARNTNLLSTLIGGLLMGAAICGMHYLGQVGISNYHATFETGFVIGAAIIAVTASALALSIFFFSKARWTNMWYKRMGCAIGLATGVSGMHWCATIGTSYRLESLRESNALSPVRVINTVTVLSICACLVLVALSFIGQRRKYLSAQRAKQVIVAAVYFDQDGKLMVNSDGLLPCRKITNAFLEKSFNEVFDVGHPVFSWIFKASHCWGAVSDMIPHVREHIRVNEPPKGLESTMPIDNQLLCPVCRDDYTSLFKAHFLVAASDLAIAIQQPMESLGILFDDVMSTGVEQQKTAPRLRLPQRVRARVKDEESISISESLASSRTDQFGTGQHLFAVRKLTEQEAIRLCSSGFTFTPQSYIADHLASKTQVGRSEMANRLKRMYAYVTSPKELEAGTHLACFALRPLVGRGFDVLVTKNARNLLPSVKILDTNLSEKQMSMLGQLDGQTVKACRDRLRHRSISNAESDLVSRMLDGIDRLRGSMDPTYLNEARLVAQPLKHRCSSDVGATLIAFRIMLDVHDYTKYSEVHEFIPLKFFITQQRTYAGSPIIEAFGRQVRQELAHTAIVEPCGQRKVSNASTLRSSIRVLHRPGTRSENSFSSQAERTHPKRSTSCGDIREGLHGTQYLAVNAMQANSSKPALTDQDGDNVSLQELRSPSNQVYHNPNELLIEEETFVEKLIALTIDERKHRYV